MMYAAAPTPDSLAVVLRALDPTLNAEITRYPGPKPLLKSHARRLAIEAVKKYDPSKGTKLRTWVTSSLQPLNRIGTNLRSQVHVPEVARRQSAAVNKVREELFELSGREPTDEEIGDELGINPLRVRKLRSAVPAVMAQSGMGRDEDGAAIEPLSTFGESDPSLRAALEMVYASVDERDKRILEWKAGYKGGVQRSNQDIAKRLGVSPAFVSQRSQLLSQQIMETRSHVGS